MVTLDDIAAAVLARCRQAPAFTAALPGGAFLDRGPDNPGGAYAVFTFEHEGEAEWISDGTYLQGFTLRMVAYTVQGTETSSPQQAQLGMSAALNPQGFPWAALRAGTINIALPRGYDGKYAPELRGGKDVFAAAGQWHLLIEGNLAP